MTDKANPEYITALKAEVKNSPYPRHMAMALDRIEFDAADIVLNLDQYHLLC
mgnify:FL=1